MLEQAGGGPESRAKKAGAAWRRIEEGPPKERTAARRHSGRIEEGDPSERRRRPAKLGAQHPIQSACSRPSAGRQAEARDGTVFCSSRSSSSPGMEMTFEGSDYRAGGGDANIRGSRKKPGPGSGRLIIDDTPGRGWSLSGFDGSAAGTIGAGSNAEKLLPRGRAGNPPARIERPLPRAGSSGRLKIAFRQGGGRGTQGVRERASGGSNPEVIKVSGGLKLRTS